MKKNIFLLLIIFVVIFLSVSCEVNDKEIGLGLPEKLQGVWCVFKGYKTSIRIMIDGDSIQSMDMDKGGIVYDVVNTNDGAILSQFDPKTYSPVDKLVGYEPIYSDGYQLKWQDKVIWLMYAPESDAMRFILIEGINNSIKYNYHLIRL